MIANLAAVLRGDANGISAFLGKASIVDDPGRDGRAGGHLGKDALRTAWRNGWSFQGITATTWCWDR